MQHSFINEIPQGPTKKEILLQIPELKKGSWAYWVFFKARISPIGEKRTGRHFSDIYPPDSVDRIKAVLASRKTGCE